jgi:hypothetical protein
MSAWGQNRKSSMRAYVFRFAPGSGHCGAACKALSPAHRPRVLGRSWQPGCWRWCSYSRWIDIVAFGCDREDGRRCCRHRGWSSNPLFRASQPLVPELTRSADIKLNPRISLPRAVIIVSSSQLRGVSPRPSHHDRAIRGRRFAKGTAAPPIPLPVHHLRAGLIA